VKLKVTELEEELDKPTITTLLTLDRTTRQKISKNTEELNNITNYPTLEYFS